MKYEFLYSICPALDEYQQVSDSINEMGIADYFNSIPYERKLEIQKLYNDIKSYSQDKYIKLIEYKNSYRDIDILNILKIKYIDLKDYNLICDGLSYPMNESPTSYDTGLKYKFDKNGFCNLGGKTALEFITKEEFLLSVKQLLDKSIDGSYKIERR